MCKGSVRSRSQVKAVPGVQYLIGKTEYDDRQHPDRQGVIFAEGSGYEPQAGDDRGKVVTCAACIDTETRVMLSGIPAELQKRLKVDQVTLATFVPGTRRHRSQDKIRIGEHLFKLWEFADQGVTLSLVMAGTDSDTKMAPMRPIAEREPALATA